MANSEIRDAGQEGTKEPELCSEGPTFGVCNILTGAHQGLHEKRKGCLFWNPRPFDAESLARFFHETYERLAPEFCYETRKESARPWAKVPLKNKGLMIAVCKEILLARHVPVSAPVPPLPKETLVVCEFSDIPHPLDTHGRAGNGSCRDFESAPVPERTNDSCEECGLPAEAIDPLTHDFVAASVPEPEPKEKLMSRYAITFKPNPKWPLTMGGKVLAHYMTFKTSEEATKFLTDDTQVVETSSDLPMAEFPAMRNHERKRS